MYTLDAIQGYIEKSEVLVDSAQLARYYTFLNSRPTVDESTYTDSHHILPRSMFPELIKVEQNFIDLTTGDHLRAHYYLALSFPECRSIQVAFFLMNANKHYASSVTEEELPLYEKLYTEAREHLRSLISQTNTGTVTVRNDLGVLVRVPLDDPKYLSGEWESQNTGTIVVKDEEGARFAVKADDPRWISGELVGIATGTEHTLGYVWRFDGEGNRLFLPPNDPRLGSGALTTDIPSTYQHATKGKIIAYDKEGKRVLIDAVDDPRILSDELTLAYPSIHPTKGTIAAYDDLGKQYFVKPDDLRLGTLLTRVPPSTKKNPNKGKVKAHDKKQRMFYVSPDDPRLASGEFMLGVSPYVIENAKGREFTPLNKNKLAAHTKEGKVTYVSSGDPQLLTGELTLGTPVGVSNQGKFCMADKEGKITYALPDDPRVLSGELKVHKFENFHLRGRVGALDSDGMVYRVSPSDPRLCDGTLVLQKTKRKKKSRVAKSQ